MKTKAMTLASFVSMAFLASSGPTSLALAAAPAGIVEGVVAIHRDGSQKTDRSGVVVSIVDVPGARPRPIEPKPEIHQRELQFTTPLTVIPAGTTVEFPNDDKVFHNVFSVSKTQRFDLGLYKSGSSKGVTFKHEGEIDVYCNIHPQMVAKIKVVDTPFYAVTDASGRFRIADVPPGKYRVVAWQASGEPQHAEVVVQAGKTSALALELVEARVQKRHLRKDGTPYGRYK